MGLRPPAYLPFRNYSLVIAAISMVSVMLLGTSIASRLYYLVGPGADAGRTKPDIQDAGGAGPDNAKPTIVDWLDKIRADIDKAAPSAAGGPQALPSLEAGGQPTAGVQNSPANAAVQPVPAKAAVQPAPANAAVQPAPANAAVQPAPANKSDGSGLAPALDTARQAAETAARQAEATKVEAARLAAQRDAELSAAKARDDADIRARLAAAEAARMKAEAVSQNAAEALRKSEAARQDAEARARLLELQQERRKKAPF